MNRNSSNPFGVACRTVLLILLLEIGILYNMVKENNNQNEKEICESMNTWRMSWKGFI